MAGDGAFLPGLNLLLAHVLEEIIVFVVQAYMVETKPFFVVLLLLRLLPRMVLPRVLLVKWGWIAASLGAFFPRARARAGGTVCFRLSLVDANILSVFHPFLHKRIMIRCACENKTLYNFSPDMPCFTTILKRKLMHGLSVSKLTVVNTSASHQGHAGSPNTGHSHFDVFLVAKDFTGLSRVARHRLVYGLLQKELQQSVHALSLQALTPKEFAEKS